MWAKTIHMQRKTTCLIPLSSATITCGGDCWFMKHVGDNHLDLFNANIIHTDLTTWQIKFIIIIHPSWIG